MGFRLHRGFAAGILVCAALAASRAGAQFAGTDLRDPGRFKEMLHHVDIRPDGSTFSTTHSEFEVHASALIPIVSQTALDYSESLQDLEVTGAYTLKPDGTKIAVAPSAILTRQKPTPNPVFSDVKQKVVLFPNVEVGDTLVYDATMQSKPLIPGFFSYSFAYPRVFEVDDSRIVFAAPHGMKLYLDYEGVDVTTDEEPSGDTYTVRFHNPTSINDFGQFLSEFDRLPHIFVSSYPTYDAFADAYGAMALPKAAVTPQIQAKADEITAGVSDRREQARKIYEWVSKHVRYLAVMLGDGGIVPHDASTVLANAYGDCKDHAVLYSALLKAKGIASELVILNGSNGYTASRVPAIGTFNHMIVWLPEFALYADTTSPVTPFGQLPMYEYGKPAVHVGGGHGALRQTPLLLQGDSSYASTTVLTLDDAGRLTARQTTSANGAAAASLRGFAEASLIAGTAALAESVLQKRGIPDGAGNYQFQDPAGSDPTYTFEDEYHSDHSFALLSTQGFAMPEGLSITGFLSPVLLGPVVEAKYALSDSIPCFGGSATDDYTLMLPSSRKVAGLPDDGEVDTDNIRYRSHWSQNGNVVSVHREIQAKFDTALCTGRMRRDTVAALDRIHADYGKKLTLAATP